MAANDPADTHGHTHAEAAAQEPTLDLDEPAASVEQPEGDPNLSVLAQTAAEVSAQIANVPG